MADPYLYPGTYVLKNKLGLLDGNELQAAEYREAALRTTDAVAYAARHRKLNERTWRGIHRLLFANIYSWAGRLRTVELSKGRTVFAPVQALRGYADANILPVYQSKARQAGADDMLFAEALGECWGELNFLHPFREGNGRATQLFVMALARQHGRDIVWSKVDRLDEVTAAVAAANKDYEPYRDLLMTAMRQFPELR